jgi:Dyp-type peroxidase family
MRSVRAMKNQFGIEFPSPSNQEHILVVRANLTSFHRATVKHGLARLCFFLDSIDKGTRRMEYLDRRGIPRSISLWEYCFTSTLGFGSGFFMKLGIANSKRPPGLKEMPGYTELGDPSPYVLAQTDMILQLASTRDYVNRWVLENAFGGISSGMIVKSHRSRKTNDCIECHDVVSAIKDWAIINDLHFGFQRTDGRNLMGFNDGISNIRRFSKDFLNIVWISNSNEKNTRFAGGTFMVFQKIEHDISQWNLMDVKTQEEWVGRSKYTGLLLGTLTEDEDRELFKGLSSPDITIRRNAERNWKRLIDKQRDPKAKLFSNDKKHSRITEECPAWSHVRKANPRQEHGAPIRLLFRRGYLFSDAPNNERAKSGLLFISFQKDIVNTFEAIKKEWLNNSKFPVPGNAKNLRPGERKWFDDNEIEYRHRAGRLTAKELLNLSQEQRMTLGLSEDEDFEEAVEEATCISNSDHGKGQARLIDCGLHNSGKEGLSGPSENGVNPHGSLIATIPLGGGYYFVPPVPKGGITQIGQTFF